MGRRAAPWLTLGAVALTLVLLVAFLLIQGVFEEDSPPAAERGPAPVIVPLSGPKPPAGLPSGAAPERVPRPTRRELALRVRVLSRDDRSPLAGARVSVIASGGPMLVSGSTDDAGLFAASLSDPPALLRLLAEAEHRQSQQLDWSPGSETRAELTLLLPPEAGWYGRVVTSLGDPLPGMQVEVRRVWPARPASFFRRDWSLVARPVSSEPPLEFTTDRTGTYFVPAMAQGQAAELLITARSAVWASRALRVPLPLSDGPLPDLVAEDQSGLSGQVVDEWGAPLPGALVELDRGPGARRRVENKTHSDEQGRFHLQRAATTVRLRVTRAGSWMERGLVGDLELLPALDLTSQVEQRARPWDQPAWRAVWMELPPDLDDLVVVLSRSARVSGFVRSSADGSAVRRARVRLEQDGVPLAAGQSDAQGAFVLQLPPDWEGVSLDLVANHPGYAGQRLSVQPVRNAEAWPVELSLQPLPFQLLIDGQVQPRVWDAVAGLDRQVQTKGPRWLELAAWWSPASGPSDDLDRMPPERWLDGMRRLPTPWPTLQPQGVHPLGFELAFDGSAQDRLLVLARSSSPTAPTRYGRWGPGPAAQARVSGVSLTLEPRRYARLSLPGLQAGSDHRLLQLIWDPWFRRVDRVRIALPRDRLLPHPLQVEIPARLSTLFELHAPRAPVDRVLVAHPEWIDPREWAGRELPSLADPPLYEVSGTVVFLDPEQRLELGVALCGSGAPDWRADELGAWDDWARPDWQGRFRFEAVPPGQYAYLLYRVIDELHVQLLAERSVTLDATLYNLDIWADAPGSGRRRELGPWWEDSQGGGR